MSDRLEDEFTEEDAAWHLLERTDVFGWPGDDVAWAQLLLALADEALIQPSTDSLAAGGWEVRASQQVQHMLVVGAMRGWIRCWHNSYDEDVCVGLTESGLTELANVLERAADRAHVRGIR